MREGLERGDSSEISSRKGILSRFPSAGSDLDRKYWVAMVLYAVLGTLAWFTLGEGSILVMDRPVAVRLLPLIVLGGLVLRTVLAHQAEKIRRDGDGGAR